MIRIEPMETPFLGFSSNVRALRTVARWMGDDDKANALACRLERRKRERIRKAVRMDHEWLVELLVTT